MQCNYNLSNKTALITGASGGLGKNFAIALANSGAKVVLAGRRQPPLQDLADQINQSGGSACVAVMDVGDQESIDNALDSAEQQFGTINVAVCNAGITIIKPAIDLSINDWNSVLNTNLTGCWLVAQSIAKRLVKQKQSGSVINISSILGHRVAGSIMPYVVSKAALEQLTKSLALEWARYNIRVNAIAPGYIKTPLNQDFFETEQGNAIIRRIPIRRLGTPEELIAPLLLLASDDSSFMTGSTIVADGGHLQSSL